MSHRLIASSLAVILSLSLSGAPTAAQSDEAAVRAVALSEADGWAKFDAHQIASAFTDDAIWQNPFGVRLHGRTDIDKFLNRLFARPGYRAAKDTKQDTITDIRLISPSTAVVWSEESSQGEIDERTGKPMAPRHSRYLEVFVKRDGVWKICDSMIMDEIT